MKKEIHNYPVIMLGDTYTVASDESEEHVVEAANYVHMCMQEYAAKASHLPVKTIAILTALKLASVVLKQEKVLHQHASKHDSLLLFIDGQFKRGAVQE